MNTGFDESVGTAAVALARQVIDSYVSGRTPEADVPKDFDVLAGAFVTLHTHPERQLRGCVGIPEPVMSLGDAVIRAAVGACDDPRFPPLRSDEADRLVVEVSILTPPASIEAEDPATILQSIDVGRDGLIIDKQGRRGLLLPQVPVEWGWDAEEYLENLCRKAGLKPGDWKDAELFSFESIIFSEKEPRGDVAMVGEVV